MNRIIDFFSGKKTYIVGTLFIILGLLQGDVQMILTGFGFFGLKAAVVKAGESRPYC